MSRFTAPRPMTLRLSQPKPRNPLVAAAKQRLAGRHQAADARQRARRELRQQLTELSP